MANQKTEAIDISLIEKLASGPTLIRSLLAAVTRAVTGPLLGGPRANTYFKDVIFAALRTNLSLITIKQESWFTGTTEAQYLEWAKKQSVQPDTDVLGSGTKIHWLGPKTAKKVVVYYHGGGFVRLKGISSFSRETFANLYPSLLIGPVLHTWTLPMAV